jgi:hypothetical protein
MPGGLDILDRISKAVKDQWINGNGVKFTEEVQWKCGASMRGKSLDKARKARCASVKGTKPFRVLYVCGSPIDTFISKSE